MKLIIDIPEDWEKGIKNMYDWDIANFLYETCRNGTPIPDNATNMDVLNAIFDARGYIALHDRKLRTKWLFESYQKGGK